MKISDIIFETILQVLEESENGVAEIKRNQMASLFGCVPSQINYVISSRFTPEQGYVVESRRGGGGYVRITQIRTPRINAVMHLIASLPAAISAAEVQVMINNLESHEMLFPEQLALMRAALSDNCLSIVPTEIRSRLRGTMFQQMLLASI